MAIHPYSPVYSFYDEYHAKNYLRTEPLEIVKVTNGTVLPMVNLSSNDIMYNHAYLGGVVDENGKYINLSAFRARPIGGYDYNKEDTILTDKQVVYLGYFFSQWGHLLVDGLARMWYLTKYDLKDFYYAIVDRAGRNRCLSGNLLRLICLLGISEDRILIVNKPTVFKEIVIPERSLCPGKYYTREYTDTVDRMINSVCKDRKYINYKYKKIFFSRKKIVGFSYTEIGNKNIEKFFKKNGFKIIYPERCTPEEQIAYIHNCDMFASADGSIAHNLIFARPKTEAIILNRRNYVNTPQYILNQTRNISSIYIDVCLALLPSSNVVSIVYYSEELKIWAMKNGYIIPRLLFPRLRLFFALLLYFIQYIRKNSELISPVMENFYGKEKSLEAIKWFYALYRERLETILNLEGFFLMFRKIFRAIFHIRH